MSNLILNILNEFCSELESEYNICAGCYFDNDPLLIFYIAPAKWPNGQYFEILLKNEISNDLEIQKIETDGTITIKYSLYDPNLFNKIREIIRKNVNSEERTF